MASSQLQKKKKKRKRKKRRKKQYPKLGFLPEKNFSNGEGKKVLKPQKKKKRISILRLI